MADNVTFDVKLATNAGPVTLPNGELAANAQFLREGQDLYLKEPDGHTIRIDGYFSHNPPPDLISADGARLTHAMVDAFLPPQHPGEYAANANANDSSAVGHVTEVVGSATITHPDGTHVTANPGVAVHMGDVVETSAKGAVHILFSDNTTFAISESARLSIDNYTYNPHAHSGTSFFSMLQGVFVYTSGLIGKEDPGNVNIETPVGSIGIRGTVIAGDINPAGHPSTITIVDGAIVVTNGGGSVELSNSFDTATLSSYSAAPVDSGVMTHQAFTSAYSSVAPADPVFYSLTGTTAPGASHTTGPETAPMHAMPDSMTQASPLDTVGTSVTTIGSTTPHITDPFDPTVTNTTVALTDPTIAQPVSATSFTSATTTFGTTATSGSTTFAGGTTTTAPATGSTLLTTAGTTSLSSGTTSSGAIATTTMTLSSGPGTTSAAATMMFTDPYLNGTPGTTADDGLPLFGPLLASDITSLAWGTTGVQIGTVTAPTLTGPLTYSITGVGGTTVVPDALLGGYDVLGKTLQFNTTTTGIIGDTAVVANQPIMHLSVSGSGALLVDFTDPFALLPNIQGPLTFNITATDSASQTATTGNFSFHIHTPAGASSIFSGPLNVFRGDELGTNTNDSFSILSGDNSNNLLYGAGGDDTILVGGGGHNLVFGGDGNDTLTWTGAGQIQIYGDAGNDTIAVQSNSFLSPTDTFSVIDGGAGTDTLQVGAFTGSGKTYNFESETNVHNIESISIAGTGTTTNTVRLDFQDIFDMTANNATHQLNIQNSGANYGSSLIVDTLGQLTSPATVFGTVGGTGVVTLSGTLVSNGQTVTLIIDQGTGPTNGVNVTVN